MDKHALGPAGGAGQAAVRSLRPGKWYPAGTATVADTFGSGANSFTIDFSVVADLANTADTSGYGGVPYLYRMGTNEVSTRMASAANSLGSLGLTFTSRSDDQPVGELSWNEAARFVNWLNTSRGISAAYKFDKQPGDAGYSANADILVWAPGDPGYDAANPYRNANAVYFLPSENEWYKAAYYKSGGTNAGYWTYATQSDSAPSAVSSGTSPNTAVYNGQSAPASVFLAGGEAAYGTRGQGGNLWEWIETAFDGTNTSGSENRPIRGGTFSSNSSELVKSMRQSQTPTLQNSFIGFRVMAVPEPGMAMAVGAGGALLAVGFVRQRAKRQTRLGITRR